MPEILRAHAQAAEADIPVEALACYRDLDALGELTPHDEARMAVLLVRLQDQMDGVLRLNRLLKKHPKDMAFARAKRDVEKLLEPLSDCAEIANRDFDSVAFALGQSFQKAGGNTIDLIPTTPETVRKALAQITDEYPNPCSGFTAYSRRAALRRFMATISPHCTLDVKAAAISFLREEGENRLVVDFTTRAEALMDEGIFTACVDALVATHRFKEAAALAGAMNAPIPVSTQWTVRALVELKSPQPNRKRASEWLKIALEAAQSDGRPPAMEAAGQVALEYGLPEIAAEAFAQALLLGTGVETSVTDYITSARRAHVPAEVVADIVVARAHRDPLSADLAKRLAYFQLLVGRDLEVVSASVKSWLETDPEDPFALLLEALLAERLGNATQAVSSLTHLPPCKWHPGEIAVIAGIAARNGRTVDAAMLAKDLTDQELFQEEIRFLDAARLTLPITAMNEAAAKRN